MRFYKGTRQWILWPCIVGTLIGCLFLYIAGKKRYTFSEAPTILHQLTQRHASEEEVIEILGYHSKLTTSPGSEGQVRKFSFTNESLNTAELLEALPIYDDNKRVTKWICESQKLKGTNLWKYRWEWFLGRMGL